MVSSFLLTAFVTLRGQLCVCMTVYITGQLSSYEKFYTLLTIQCEFLTQVKDATFIICQDKRHEKLYEQPKQ